MPDVELLNVALEQHRAGNLAVAERLYRQLLADSPEWADAWHLLGALCIQANRPAEATEALERAISLKPHQADFHSHLGAAYGALKRHDEAVTQLQYAVRLNPQAATAHYNLGTALRNAERLEEAVASFRHSLAADPAPAETHYNLANALRDLKRVDEAEASYREAIRRKPGYLKAMINLGNLLTGLKRREESIAVLRETVALHPRSPRSHLNLGTALRDAGRFAEAIAPLETSVALDPNAADAQNLLGTAYQSHAEFDRAARHYQLALSLNPKLGDAHFSYGTHLLREGDLERGFPEYDWRWKCKSFSTRTFERPPWNGEPLAGRTILLHAEQGLGDTLQFVRYVADVRRLGGRVILECQPALVKLLSSVEGVDELIPAGTPVPAHDVHCPLLSVPGVLHLKMDELWRGPYLNVEPARAERWRARLSEYSGLRVGVCWRGNPEHLFDRQRSFGLEPLAPLATIPGIRWISLQKGSGETQEVQQTALNLVDLGPELDADGAFLDTAAVVAGLDLVITADTSIAHLAGALGAPVWLALSAHNDWRWFSGREDSPWYPSMRLFRQSRLDRWDDVFERIGSALVELAARRS